MSEPVESSSSIPLEDVASMLVYVNGVIVRFMAPIVMEAALYGIFFALGVASLYIQWNKLKTTPSTPNKIITLVTFLLFALVTTYISIEIFVTFESNRILFTSKSNQVEPLHASAYESNAAVMWHDYTAQIMLLSCLWIADAVLIWRACVIWSYDIKALVLLGVPLLFTFATTIWDLVVLHRYISFQGSEAAQSSAAADAARQLNRADVVRLLASLCTNWLATVAIACKLFLFRKRVVAQLKQTSAQGHMRAYGILTNLVEMGFFLGAYQLAIASFGFKPSEGVTSRVIAYNMLYSALPFIAGINPILTIILVNKHYSIAEATSRHGNEKAVHPHPQSGVASRLMFAHTAPDSTSLETDSYSRA